MTTYTSHYSGVVDYEKLPCCSIRLIRINAKSRDSDEPLQAQMISMCLDGTEQQTSNYLALSYVWSSEERDFPMLLNGKPIKVTRTLGELFTDNWSNMPEGNSTNWWVDQLCINQEDDEDKTQQIPRMKEIYEKARRVVVYIRPAFKDARLAIDLMSRLTVLSSKQPQSGRLLDALPMSEIYGPATDENIRSWEALRCLYDHQYWTRTWILPEATAQLENCHVFCDGLDFGVPIGRVFLIGEMHKRFSTRDRPPEFLSTKASSAPVARVETFAQLRRSSQVDYRRLFELLFITRRTECTRPEDKIYSMLPFAPDVGDYVNDPYLKPSYGNGCAFTYGALVKWYVTKYKNLDFLGYCTATKHETTQIPGFRLPSWVPNWTHASYLMPLRKCHDHSLSDGGYPLYKACGPFSYSIEIVEMPSSEFWSDKLFVSGLRIATVHKVLQSAPDGGYWESEIQYLWKDEFDASAKYSLTQESYRDAFERTVVADVTFDDWEGTFSRPGKVKWWRNSGNVDREESGRWELQMRFATGDRKLFFAKSSPVLPVDDSKRDTVSKVGSRHLGADCESFLMGLGRSDVAIGDQIWAMKGGQVLYVLRQKQGSTVTVQNIAEAREPGWPSCPSMLWLNGKSYPWTQALSGSDHSFVGECYVHGLMDGEALDFASRPPEERPDVLTEMAGDLQEIFIRDWT